MSALAEDTKTSFIPLVVPVIFRKPEGSANERAARLKETPQPTHLTRDADAHRGANVRSLSNRGPKPKRTPGTEVNSVQAPVDFQCSRQPSGTSSQIFELAGVAEPLHPIDSIKRLHGAQQHSSTNSRLFRAHVEHV